MRPPKLCRNSDGRAFAIYPRSGNRRAWFGRYDTPEATAAYKTWLGDLLDAVAAGTPAGLSQTPSVAELAVAYLDWCEANYSRGEYRNNRETIGFLFVPHSGTIRANDFGPNRLRAFQSHLATSGRFARSTANSHVNRVRRFFRWCRSRELIPAGIVEDLSLVLPLRRGRTEAIETAPVEPVAAEVWRATLPFLRPPLRAVVQVQYWCGMRPGEVCSLRPRDVDRTHEVWLYRPAAHKTSHRGKTLVKAIPPAAQAILSPWLGGPPDRPAFATIRGRAYACDTYGAAVRRAARRARDHGVNVPDWSPNQLRHAILTEIRDRLGQDAARQWAGHSDAATTLVYSWTATAELRRIAAALSDADRSSTR